MVSGHFFPLAAVRVRAALTDRPTSNRHHETGTVDPQRGSGLIDTFTAPQYNQRHCVHQRQTHRMAEERAQRRLAAILAADVVGYSRLMEQDEAGTLAALKARHKDVVRPLVAKHQ